MKRKQKSVSFNLKKNTIIPIKKYSKDQYKDLFYN